MTGRGPEDVTPTDDRPTRRAFLGGLTAVVGAGALLAACGDDSGGGAAAPPADGDGDVEEAPYSAARFYGPYFLAGQPARVPFGLADADGLLDDELAPDGLTATVRTPEKADLLVDVPVPRYADGLPRPYYVIEFTPEVEGFYDLVLQTPDGEVLTQVQVVPADDPAASAIVGPGDAMLPIVTPTVDDARGVTPICTREPACALHTRTVAEVLEAGEPMVLLVATPAFCQTVVCGPVLDLLLDVLADASPVTAVHAEVYVEPTANSVPPVPDDFAPVIDELGLAFEPVLYTVAADGTVVDRLDYIFSTEEIRAAVERLVG